MSDGGFGPVGRVLVYFAEELEGYVGRRDDPGVKIVELTSIGTGQVEMPNKKIMCMNLISIIAAHQTNLNLIIWSGLFELLL